MEILKNIRKNAFIIVIITILVMYFVLRKDFPLIIRNFKSLDLKYLLLAFLCFVVYIVIRSYVVYKTVNQKENFTFKESIKHNVIVQFFNGITPFSTGGQPMEIYMLSRHGISVSKSTNYILQNFIFYQIALVIFGLIAVVVNYIFKLFPNIPLLRELVLIGFLVNTFVAIFLLFIIFSEKVLNRIIQCTIKLFNYFRIVKDVDKTTKNWQRRVGEFHESAIELRRNIKLFVIGILLNFIALACLYVIPLFLVFSLNDFTSLNAICAIVSSAYVMVAASFVPIPGASGGIEYAFTKFFGNFLSSTNTATTLLLWRFITYYLGMILGAIFFNLDKDDK